MKKAIPHNRGFLPALLAVLLALISGLHCGGGPPAATAIPCWRSLHCNWILAQTGPICR